MATDASSMDLDSRRNCLTCKTRMSSLLHDSHTICCACRGYDCFMDKRCSECEAWSEEVMLKFVKYRKSLESNVRVTSAASAGVSEVRVTELIAEQLGQFSSSFAASMQASFENIRSFIDDKFASQDSQPETNPSFADSSPVLVDLGPRQTQTDPSVRSPCIDYGSGGEAQESVQVGSATSSFLASLRAAGIIVPQGVVIGDRVDRAPSSATVHGAPAVAAQHEPLGGGRTTQAASAHPAPVLEVQDAQPQPISRTVRDLQAQSGLPGPALGKSPHEIAFREVTFSDAVLEFAEEDAASSSSEKVAVSEGRRNVLRLLYQLCPGAAPKSPLMPCKVCDFEGLFCVDGPCSCLRGRAHPLSPCGRAA